MNLIEPLMRHAFRKDFSQNFQEFLDESNRDSLLVAEASDLMTNRNYLFELKRLNKITNVEIDNIEYWRLIFEKS